MTPAALTLALHVGAAAGAQAAPREALPPTGPTLPAHLSVAEAPAAAPSVGGPSALQSAAMLKAAVDRTQTTGRIGIITTYSGLGATLIGAGLIWRGAMTSLREDDVDAGIGAVGGGLALTFGGSLAFVGGASTLAGSSLAGALHLRKLDPTHSAAAGWISAGGLGALVSGALFSLTPTGSTSETGTTISGLGLITALVSGHIQHARNRTRRESLAALHPRTPGPLAPTLAYH